MSIQQNQHERSAVSDNTQSLQQRLRRASQEQQQLVERILDSRRQTGGEPLPQDEALLTKKEIAARTKVTTRTIENWQRRGIIPFIKVRKVTLFCWPDVLKHLKANHQVCRHNVIP